MNPLTEAPHAPRTGRSLMFLYNNVAGLRHFRGAIPDQDNQGSVKN
jgi:hypothetical protein